MKSLSYMTRALKAHDPRYARILGKLGYDRADMHAAAVDDIGTVRAEYESVVGKKAFNGWDIEQLREKIAAAKSQG